MNCVIALEKTGTACRGSLAMEVRILAYNSQVQASKRHNACLRCVQNKYIRLNTVAQIVQRFFISNNKRRRGNR